MARKQNDRHRLSDELAIPLTLDVVSHLMTRWRYGDGVRIARAHGVAASTVSGLKLSTLQAMGVPTGVSKKQHRERIKTALAIAEYDALHPDGVITRVADSRRGVNKLSISAALANC